MTLRRPCSRRLDGSQIKPEGPGIFAAQVERGHVWMVDHQAIPQAVHETVKIDTATELAKWRGSGVRAFCPGGRWHGSVHTCARPKRGPSAPLG